MKLLFLTLAIAHASWWSNFCEKHLIADDPYQFEQTGDVYLLHEIERLEIKERWGTLSKAEEKILRIMQKEMERR